MTIPQVGDVWRHKKNLTLHMITHTDTINEEHKLLTYYLAGSGWQTQLQTQTNYTLIRSTHEEV